MIKIYNPEKNKERIYQGNKNSGPDRPTECERLNGIKTGRCFATGLSFAAKQISLIPVNSI